MTKREAELEKEIEAISIRLLQTLAQLDKAREEVAFLRKQLYGPKTDRPCVEVQFIMGELFYNEGETTSSDHGGDHDACSADAPEPAGVENESPSKKRGSKKKSSNKPGRLSLVNTGLEEREILVLPNNPETYTNPETGVPYEILRYDETRRLAEEPARLLIIVEKRPVYIKKIDLETGETTLVTTPAPDNHPIDRCKADVSLLVSILIYKYMWHLPLYRMQEIFHAKSDIWIARSTMCGWITGCATALEPVVKLMRGEMMKQKLLGMDDTTVCQLAPGEGRVAACKLWAYTSPLEAAPYVVYDYTPNREGCHPLAFIDEDFNGYIQGDAYSGHHAPMNRPGVKGVGCWDHARRYVVDASVNDPKKCARPVFLINQLYKVEALAKERGLSGEERKTLRLEKSRPVLDEIKQWVGEMAMDPFIKESMRKAVVYLTNQWQNLTRYLEDGDIPISNILTEQAMRGVGVGRKNWLFAGSARGGENLAIILSIVTTCRVNRIDVRKYLDDVLRRVNAHPNHRLAELLPDRWAAIREAQGESVRVTGRKEWRKDDAFEVA